MGMVNIMDIVALLDHLYIGYDPLPDPVAANVDLCNGVDLGDLMLLIYKNYIDLSIVLCDGSIDCDYQSEGNTVELAVSFWPHEDIEYTDPNLMQIDMWVQNASELKAAEMYCSWDNPKVRFVGYETSSDVDSAFYPDSTFTDLAIGGDNFSQTFFFRGYNIYRGLPADPGNKWIWVRYLFEVDGWTAGDSIVIDLDPIPSGAELTMVGLQPPGVPYGFTPEWGGRLVIKDGFEQCCGMYVDPPDETGNTNCSYDGKITLSDITRLIDKVYISKDVLCCSPNGNTNSSVDRKHTLSDITKLIDRVYITKLPAGACL